MNPSAKPTPTPVLSSLALSVPRGSTVRSGLGRGGLMETPSQEPKCRLCDRPAFPAYGLCDPGIELCGSCAERVANAYHYAHSGKWLTRPNKPPPPSKKAKIPAFLRRQVFERDGYRCVTCGGWLDLCCDHRIPESKGGETTFENLQCLCRVCNTRKGAS
jgi:hypothetical protein